LRQQPSRQQQRHQRTEFEHAPAQVLALVAQLCLVVDQDEGQQQTDVGDQRVVGDQRPAADTHEHAPGGLDAEQQKHRAQHEHELGAVGAEQGFFGARLHRVVGGRLQLAKDAPQLLPAGKKGRRQHHHRGAAEQPQERELGQTRRTGPSGHQHMAEREAKDDDDQDRRIARTGHHGARDQHHGDDQKQRQPELVEQVELRQGEALHGWQGGEALAAKHNKPARAAHDTARPAQASCAQPPRDEGQQAP